MNKILQDICTCGCNHMLPENLLKITAGNDFSIELQVTEKVDEDWVHYDMSEMSNVTVSVVSPNSVHTEVDSTVDAHGNITAVVDAQKFSSYVMYGIEVIWQDDNEDKRAYAKDVFAFVDSSVEATDSAYEYTSDNPYEYNIKISNDVAIISIGRIPDQDLSEYVTETELATTLQDYATTEYVDDAMENIDLDDYYTKSEIDTTLTNYGTSLDKTFTAILGSGMSMNVDLQNSQNERLSRVSIPAFHILTTNSDPGWMISPDSETIGLVAKSGLTYILDNMSSTANKVTAIESDYVTSTSLNTTLSDYATISSLSDYVTTTSLSTTLNDYVTDTELSTSLNPITSDISSLDTRVTTLENNPSVPSNVVTSDDGNEIICLTQAEYDALEQAQTVDPDAFYYITDATSNYVTQTDMTAVQGDITSLDTRVTTLEQSGGSTPANMVTTDTNQTITGLKTFVGTNTFNGESQFIDTQNSHTLPYIDNCYEIAKSGIFARGSFLQACIGQILAPRTSVSDNTAKYDNQVGAILFQKIDGSTGGPRYNPTSLTTLAKIDGNGIYEGTTLLSDKYALKTEIPTSSGVSEEDWDNSNEAIAQELTNNRLEHLSINDNFNNYYTKTEADSRYATQGWANSRFVTQADDLNRQQAIAAAFASSVQSTSVHNIWTGSQNDYDLITTPDINTLYIII